MYVNIFDVKGIRTGSSRCQYNSTALHNIIYCGLVLLYNLSFIFENIDLANGLLPDGTKPLPKPMLIYCQLFCISMG